MQQQQPRKYPIDFQTVLNQFFDVLFLGMSEEQISNEKKQLKETAIYEDIVECIQQCIQQKLNSQQKVMSLLIREKVQSIKSKYKI